MGAHYDHSVLVETHALLINRAHGARAAALQFLDLVEGGDCEIIRVTEVDERDAIALLRAQADKSYSLCDALSFVVMKRLGIREALAFDRHFRQFGVTVLE